MHRLLALGTGLLVVSSCLLAGAAWRLAQGPIDLGGWSDRLKSALIDDAASVRVSFDGVFLAWEGFSKGVDYPLDLRLSGVTITDPAGQRLIAAPGAHLTFSLAGLLLGRFVPRAIEVDHAQIAVTRAVGGAINLGGDLAGVDTSGSGTIDLRQIQDQLAHPASGDRGRTRGLFDQLRRVHFRNTEVALRDQQSGLVIRTQDMDLDLVRARTGRIRGLLRAPLSIGNQQTSLSAQADWALGSGVTLDTQLTALRPAEVGAIPQALAFLTGIDAPVALATTIGLDAGFRPNQIRTHIQVGQGRILVGQGSVPVRSADITASGKPGEITVSKGHFDVAHTPEGRPELIDIGGT
ncbi:MAG TPA: hypothetical protein VGH13_19545, partial [Xanthobacteraceae bacterium]